MQLVFRRWLNKMIK